MFIKPRPSVQSFFDTQAPRLPYMFFFFLFPYCLFGDVPFPSIFCTVVVFSVYGEYVVRFFFPDGVSTEKSERIYCGPSEHPPVRGGNVKTFTLGRWDPRLQIQKLLMAFKRVPLW